MNEPVKVRPKIHIAICTHRHMNPFFVNCMFFMLSYMNKIGLDFEINSHAGVSNIVSGRQNRLNEAVKSDATHLLFLDDDMVFAMDAVHKMLEELNKLALSGIKKSAMGVNPCRKSPYELHYTAKGLNDEFLKSKGQSGVVEVVRCGLGLFLIETAILREIPAPHFEIAWLPEKSEHQGEDFFFIKKLREHGVRVFVDQDISQTIGHAGEFIYSYGSYNVEASTKKSIETFEKENGAAA